MCRARDIPHSQKIVVNQPLSEAKGVHHLLDLVCPTLLSSFFIKDTSTLIQKKNTTQPMFFNSRNANTLLV